VFNKTEKCSIRQKTVHSKNNLPKGVVRTCYMCGVLDISTVLSTFPVYDIETKKQKNLICILYTMYVGTSKDCIIQQT